MGEGVWEEGGWGRGMGVGGGGGVGDILSTLPYTALPHGASPQKGLRTINVSAHCGGLLLLLFRRPPIARSTHFFFMCSLDCHWLLVQTLPLMFSSFLQPARHTRSHLLRNLNCFDRVLLVLTDALQTYLTGILIRGGFPRKEVFW